MRVNCPHCGPRDLREFYVKGAAVVAASGDLDALHSRENPAGRLREFWHHEGGCRAWLVVERDTLTHEIYAVFGVSDAS